jgi:hypothetical protein
MATEDELYFVGLFQRDHEIGVLLAGYAENIFYAFGLEAFDEQI